MPLKLSGTKLTIAAIIVIAIIGTVWTCYRYLRPKPRFYPGFGILLTRDHKYVGIDVSRYQGTVFWQDAAAMRNQQRNLTFVFIKATEGCNNVDEYFLNNWKAAGNAGLKRGAYHYFHPDQNVTLQVQHFIRSTSLEAGDMVPVLDVEVTGALSAAALRDSVCKWLTAIEYHYKTAPLIYTSASFYNNYLLGSFDTYPLWIAHYKTDKPAVKRAWQFWQISDCGHVNGIGCPVDFNVFSGDSTALQALTLQ